MFKLAPLLSYCFAINFSVYHLYKTNNLLLKDIQSDNFQLLEVMHHLSSGFKSFYTPITYNGLDNLRQACGGAGFLSWSGFPLIVADYAPNTTYEGDNTVMAQQSARFLIKNLKKIEKGKKATGILEYLNSIPTLINKKCSV